MGPYQCNHVSWKTSPLSKFQIFHTMYGEHNCDYQIRMLSDCEFYRLAHKNFKVANSPPTFSLSGNIHRYLVGPKRCCHHNFFKTDIKFWQSVKGAKLLPNASISRHFGASYREFPLFCPPLRPYRRKVLDKIWPGYLSVFFPISAFCFLFFSSVHLIFTKTVSVFLAVN